MQPFDIVIRNGTIVTATDTTRADVAIAGGTIAAIGRGLESGKREIDASGKYVMPGGIDAHAHIEQLTASGLLNSDNFESATKSAALGGTTTVLCFAAQHVGMSLTKVVEDYHALAQRGAVIDYAFHMILADPREEVLRDELPPLIEAGHSSLKVFMTYDRLRVDDMQLLDVLMAARENKALVLVHAENHGMITWLSKRLLAKGYTAPRYHAVSHPRLGEVEAFTRLIAFAEFIDQPIMIYHVSSAEGAAVIRAARGRGLKVFAETCPQYLFLTKNDLDKSGIEGAKWMCSPPVREPADQETLWQALSLGDLQLVSSDHAPYAFNEKGKVMAGTSANFKQIPNGMPGLQARLPLLFDAMVSNGRFGAQKFVEWTSTAPAQIYGLAPRKGAIAVGADADIALWDPDKRVTFSDVDVVDGAGYTPYVGRTVRGWPVAVLRRGEVIAENGSCVAKPGSGEFLPRKAGAAAEPLGRSSPEFDPGRNFGARLY
ncbi:MAG: dihydropyrimidinase [Methylobacteriaceae bacterium]|nr:dihydropyrimidinase [Methylobacteriaceae bacterium]